MKILYISCHLILEYDELKIFNKIDGLKLFSTGAYIVPTTKQSVRPILSFNVDNDDIITFNNNGGKWNNVEFLDRFDIIYFMHNPTEIFDNWKLIKNRKIIWRTIGQSTPEIELKMQVLRKENPNMKIVRYSPTERRHENFSGEDVMIRFGKDPKEFCSWNGNIKKVITVVQSMKSRGDACGWNIFSKISEKLPCKLFGHNNESGENLWNGKNLTYDEILQVYRDYRVYFYAGTKPASYCLNFIEAWMTGIPIVAIGPTLGNGLEQLYEIHDLISYGKDGYWADYPEDIIRISNMLMDNDDLAKEISEAGRYKAMELFDENKIKIQWEEFYKTLL